MAKVKILGLEMEGLPTVQENAEKMGKARARLGEAKHRMLGEIKARKLLLRAGGMDETLRGPQGVFKEMRNVTPIPTDGAIDVSPVKLIAPKKDEKEAGH